MNLDLTAFTTERETRDSTSTNARPVRIIRQSLRERFITATYEALTQELTAIAGEAGFVVPGHGHVYHDDTDTAAALRAVFNLVAPEGRKMDAAGAETLVAKVRGSIKETEEEETE